MSMELNVKVEMPSNILRKLTIRVPAKVVANRYQKGLAEVQRTAKLKGFRPGQAPISVIKQFYGEDVRLQVYHRLIDESFDEAVREQKLRAIGRPNIEAPDHKTGAGEHDHGIKEDSDLTYTATVEVVPEIEVKGYTGIAVTQEKVELKDAEVDQVVISLQNAHAELTPVGGGLTLADGSQSSRPVQKGDFADIEFSGGIVTDTGIQEREGMKGSQMIEVGAGGLIPGFEDNIIGMRRGEKKTFRVPFPADYSEKELAGKDSEFTVSVNEVKEKKLPELNDEFAKEAGYESVADLRAKARDYLTRERTEDSERKVRSQLIEALIEKNAFDVPQALVESQTRALAQDWAEELKRQGVPEARIREAVVGQLDEMRKRADGQVRASLILEAIAKKEDIAVKEEDLDSEIKKIATSMRVEEDKLRDYYAKNPGRKEDLEFRLRQERTLKFLLDKAKIKSISPKEK